mmetsp:Transcript_19967/g.57081  ORF Transcript_19967/g.57081 Transcript_19967/m.57081 type:complete len:171 (+) Transcript_19967:127-639(+)
MGEDNVITGDVVQINRDVYFGPVHENNVGQLRRLQEAILPVQYKDSFFTQVIDLSKEKLARLAYFKDIMVGTACSRVESREGREGKYLYIMTLAVLPAYRSRDIGTELIKDLEKTAREMGLEGIFLHVWTTNEDAIRFYKRLGFDTTETLKGYYKDISPPDGYVLEKSLK